MQLELVRSLPFHTKVAASTPVLPQSLQSMVAVFLSFLTSLMYSLSFISTLSLFSSLLRFHSARYSSCVSAIIFFILLHFLYFCILSMVLGLLFEPPYAHYPVY